MSTASTTADWVAVDWGTSNIRAWAMSDTGEVRATTTAPLGMGQLSPTEFEPTLLSLISPWLTEAPITVVACGMVGSRQGWCEAPYRATPCTAGTRQTIQALTTDPRLTVHIIPGIRQDKPADVMRGEETQITGFLAGSPDFDGVLCLPGTHTKWVHISAGEIVSFQTFMTGELFAALGKSTVLRHSVSDTGWDAAAFDAAVSTTLSRPERLAAALFTIRADGLLKGQGPDAANAALSGLLIGAELAAARPYWLGQNVALLGAPQLMTLYGTALATQGVTAEHAAADTATLAGIAAVYTKL